MSPRMKVNGWSGSVRGDGIAVDADVSVNTRPFTSPVKIGLVNGQDSHRTADGCDTGVLLTACALHCASLNAPLTNVRR